MAGSERSGPFAASAALFDGRPVGGHAARRAPTPTPSRRSPRWPRLCGATPVMFTPEEHDQAVARTSHLPHLLAALAAGRLTDAPARAPRAVRPGRPRRHPHRGRRPRAVAADHHRQHRRAHACCCATSATTSTPCSSRWPTATGPRLAEILDRGVAGTAVIPASTAARPARRPSCSSPCPTTPASSPGCWPTRARSASTSRTCGSTTTRRRYGLVELTVATEHVDHLLSSLGARGWTAHR